MVPSHSHPVELRQCFSLLICFFNRAMAAESHRATSTLREMVRDVGILYACIVYSASARNGSGSGCL